MLLFIFLVRIGNHLKKKTSAKSSFDHNTHLQLEDNTKNDFNPGKKSSFRNSYNKKLLNHFKNKNTRIQNLMNDDAAVEEQETNVKESLVSPNKIPNKKKYSDPILKMQNSQQKKFLKHVQNERAQMEKIMSKLIPGKTSTETKKELNQLKKELGELLSIFEGVEHD